jgi:NhaP-type Na+/H+ and K+/H+ antiporter
MRRDHDLHDFKYWRNELAALIYLFDGPPETALQTLRDTRNVSQWVTIWVAVFGIFILTIVFGVLATVYSVKQYKLAVESYKLSGKAFELSLAQACHQNSAPLPGFCD